MPLPTVKPLEPALISDSIMVLDEVPASKVEAIRNAVFKDIEKVWLDEGHKEGSHFQRWYRTVATGPKAVKKNTDDSQAGSININTAVQGRFIAWKTNEPFLPSNLFFRTVDTSRLLPMHLADFRVQMYADPSEWNHLHNLNGDWTRSKWKEYTLMEMVRSSSYLLKKK
jgi:hypothetical protein